MVSVPMQYYGRRKSLIGLCAPLMFGFMLMGFTYFARHKSMLYIGRMLTGFMNGAATPASQIYVKRLIRSYFKLSFPVFPAN